MQYVNLGRSGLRISRLSIGSWLTFGSSVDARLTEDCVRAALDGGVNVIDTADIYARGGAEDALGTFLPSLTRHKLVLATKLFWPMSDDPNDRGLSRKHISESIDGSLRRLKTDYIDLYQCHRYDEATPLDETVRAMGDLIRQGKVLYWGVSCWTAAQIVDACHTADQLGAPRPVSNQPPYNLMTRDIEADVIPTSAAEGLSQIVFSPLAQGVLTGKYSGGTRPEGSRGADQERNTFMDRGLAPENLKRVDAMVTIAGDLKVTPAQLALAWCLRESNVASVIFGATKVSQVVDNIEAASLRLSENVLDALEQVFPA
jgi:aryl-alcohol dehydrogenase-like predicted oxidoreductase